MLIFFRSSEALRFKLASPINSLLDFKPEITKFDSPLNF